MRPAARVGPAGLLLTLAAGAGLALASRWPSAWVLAAVVAGVGATTALRLVRSAGLRPYAIAPATLGIAIAALAAVPTSATELVGGLGGVALLLWLADDPDRGPGGARRGASELLVPALGLGIAWAAAALLPGGALPFGVGAGLLVAALIALAAVLGALEWLGRGAAETS
jgi:hypothetical protein